MNTHLHCIACGSESLYSFPTGPAEHSHLAVGLRVMEMIPIQRYVCTHCGHVEEWVNGKENLLKLKAERESHPNRNAVEQASSF